MGCVGSFVTDEYGLPLDGGADEQGQLLDDHLAIAEMLKRNDEQGAVDAGTKHLSRLDSTIDYILTEHTDYFYE